MNAGTVDERIQILANGVRLVRLEGDDNAWLREYAPILRIAAKDFLKRGGHPGEAERVVGELDDTLTHGGAVWLVVDSQYRLLGFASARLRQAAWAGTLLAEIPCAYLYPRKTPRFASRALFAAILDWARAAGATSALYTTRRTEDRALRKLTGATRVAAIYEFPLEASHG
jgi:GNAT superfamily N-acetyltransferase